MLAALPSDERHVACDGEEDSGPSEPEIKHNAAAASPPRPERARLSIPDADAVSRIIAASGSDWFHVAVVLAASSGMRRGEVLGLRWQDVDFDGGLVADLECPATRRRRARSRRSEDVAGTPTDRATGGNDGDASATTTRPGRAPPVARRGLARPRCGR
jgi:hypothetical protein